MREVRRLSADLERETKEIFMQHQHNSLVDLSIRLLTLATALVLAWASAIAVAIFIYSFSSLAEAETPQYQPSSQLHFVK